MKTIKITLLIIGVAYLNINAQQIPDINFKIFNPYIYNPAFCNGYFSNSLAFHYKQLWAGINESPDLQYLSGTYKISETMGTGGKIFNYSAGLIKKSGIEGTYAYQFKIFEYNYISMGLSVQLFQFYINKGKIKTEEEFDKAINNTREKAIYPDFTFGIIYYNNNLFIGLSILQLLNRKVQLFNEYLENQQNRQYHLTAGYKIKAAENFNVTPIINADFINSKIWQTDFKVLANYKNLITAGIGYRLKEGINFLTAYNAETISLGYSYDLSFTDLGKQSTGSHEVVLMYKFGKSGSKTLLGF